MRDFLRTWLFSRELRRLEEAETAARVSKAGYDAATLGLEMAKKRLEGKDVRDLLREDLGGFNRNLLDSEDGLPEALGSVEDQNAFLEGVRDLYGNESLWTILDYLTRDQIMYAVKEAETLAQVNFARASVNGWTLLREEVGRLHALWKERTSRPEEFDPHAVL